jgi:pimeloyl-ACP methyl ester carboxylesterase
MQKQIIIKTKDKKNSIYGVLDYKAKKDKLIIFVHGLTGNKNEHQFFNAAKYFTAKGFAVFRFDLYSGEKGARKLDDCAIETHVSDLNEVIKHFIKEYKKIYLVGHSLGGPVILQADLKLITKIVLWDPSVNLGEEDEDDDWLRFDKKINAYIASWGASYLLNKKLIEEWRNLDYRQWFGNCDIPLKVVCAGQGTNKNIWKKIIKNFKPANKLTIIKGASHTFDELGAEEMLFKETLIWFR